MQPSTSVLIEQIQELERRISAAEQAIIALAENAGSPHHGANEAISALKKGASRE